MKNKIRLLIISLCFLLSACSTNKAYPSDYPSSKSILLDEVLYTESPMTLYQENDAVIIDYSNTNHGYITAKKINDDKIKMQIIHDEEAYTYDISSDEFVGYPLQMGSGLYDIRILKNISDNNYAIIDSFEIEANIENENEPYLYPNQIIDYSKDDEIVKKSIELCKDTDNDLQRIEACYEWVIDTLEYDNEKAELSSTKYLIPSLSQLLIDKKGICFDYASLLCALLRIQHIPTRVICGDTDISYHAWIEVYLEGEGWVNPDIFIDKDIWSRMDPTFADSKYQYDGTYLAIYYY